MFEALTNRLDAAFQRLRSKGRLSESDVDEALREIRVALLEGDVNYKVAKDLIARVKERAVGAEVQKSLQPGHQVVKIVHEELIRTLGGEPAKLKLASIPPTIIFLAGLQGSGKTTTAGKLAAYLRRQSKNPILVACDLQRPAAVDQLVKVGSKAGVPVYSEVPPADPIEVGERALEYVKTTDHDVMIVDTAGRLAVDDELMSELSTLRQRLSPHDVLLVVDAMTGQDAVTVAQEFVDRVGVDGVILSKLDGDARGGAAISVREVTGAPIFFAGTGEGIGDLEPFYPDRMAGRILGMGDVLTLIDKAEQAIDREQAKNLQQKIVEGAFDLEDFLQQMRQLRKAGPFSKLLSLLPGIPGIGKLDEADIDEREIARLEAMILSMTPDERRNPKIIDGSRRKRIAAGSGMKTQDVNALLRQFGEVQKMMKQVASIGSPRKLMKLVGSTGLDSPAAVFPKDARKHPPQRPKHRSQKKKKRRR
jgi:signal recognition particle subunit SRP54